MKSFLALRSYLPAEHLDKAKEIGSEATPGAFLDVLLDVVEECARVLTPHGSLVFELGDTYSGSGGAGGDYGEGGLRDGQNAFVGAGKRSRSGWHRDGVAVDERSGQRYRQDGYEADSGSPNGGPGWPMAKSLTLVPQTFAWALAYGRNPWTGRETERWRVRNVIAWCRPNPPVGALGDKFRPATSYLTVACKQRDRWFDLDSVREPSKNDIGVGVRPTNARVNGADENDARSTLGPFTAQMQSAGAPPLDWWKLDEDDHVALAQENAALWEMLSQAGYTIDDDRFHPATRQLIIAAKQRDRWFDLDAVREESKDTRPWNQTGPKFEQPIESYRSDADGGYDHARVRVNNPAGAPPLDWWEIPTQPYKGSHYATWPEKLVVRPIEAMCPRFVCETCGEPRRRIVEHETISGKNGRAEGVWHPPAAHGATGEDSARYTSVRTVGWTDCGHGDKWRRGVVLDPFAGSGTTLAVAEGLARDSIGIDLDSRNAELAYERCGMFLTVETHEKEGAA